MMFDEDFLDLDDDALVEAMQALEFNEDLMGGATLIPGFRAQISQSSRIAPTSSSRSIKECKLIMNVIAAERLPVSGSGCSGVILGRRYGCEVEVLNESTEFIFSKRKRMPPSNTNKIDAEDKPPFPDALRIPLRKGSKKCQVWTMAEYFGQTKVALRLVQYGPLWQRTEVGRKTITMLELLAYQQSSDYRSQGWGTEITIPILSTTIGKRQQSLNPQQTEHVGGHWSSTGRGWLASAKTAALCQRGDPSEVQYRGISRPSEGKLSSVAVLIHISFRISILESCLSNCISQSNDILDRLSGYMEVDGDSPESIQPEQTNKIMKYKGSEMHLLAASAPIDVVRDLMKSLAQEKVLNRALALKSCNGYTSFEMALLHQRDDMVQEMLQRSGNFCFAGVDEGRSSPLHTAVRGGSAQCVRLICKFLKKHGGMSINISESNAFWRASYEQKIDWQDEDEMTALARACCRNSSVGNYFEDSCTDLPRIDDIVQVLLEAGANPVKINPIDRYTPLMYACHYGNVGAAQSLLSLKKSNQDINESLLTYTATTVPERTRAAPQQQRQNTRDGRLHQQPVAVREVVANDLTDTFDVNNTNASRGEGTGSHMGQSSLAHHLRVNARSRNILKGNDPLKGGYFNQLSVFLCDPTYVECIYGRQALHIAASKGHMNIVSLLVNIGVPLVAVDFEGNNVFHLVAKKGSDEMMSSLLAIETKLFSTYQKLICDGKSLQVMYVRRKPLVSRNNYGKTPIDEAFENGHSKLATALIYRSYEMYGKTIERSIRRHFKILLTRLPPQDIDSNVTLERGDREQLAMHSLDRTAFDEHCNSTGEVSEGGSHSTFDDDADEVEYTFALSALGRKYITGNSNYNQGLTLNDETDSTSQNARGKAVVADPHSSSDRNHEEVPAVTSKHQQVIAIDDCQRDSDDDDDEALRDGNVAVLPLTPTQPLTSLYSLRFTGPVNNNNLSSNDAKIFNGGIEKQGNSNNSDEMVGRRVSKTAFLLPCTESKDDDDDDSGVEHELKVEGYQLESLPTFHTGLDEGVACTDYDITVEVHDYQTNHLTNEFPRNKDDGGN